MSEQTLKILQMLEEGKITADEASDLLSKVEALDETASRPHSESTGRTHTPGPHHFRVPEPGMIRPPEIPDIHIPDINRIVNDALRDAFGGAFPGTSNRQESGHGPRGKVDVQGAKFEGAKFDQTDLTDAKLNEQTQLQGADLRFASFVDADLRGADLRGANLSYSDFTEAKLNDADLRGAQLHHGTYVETNFSGSNLQGADLSLSDLTDANFNNVSHPGLSLRGMQMVGIRYEASTGGAGDDSRTVELNDEQVEGNEEREERGDWEARDHQDSSWA